MKDYIKLEHGSGGALSRKLLDSVVYPFFKSSIYKELSDSASLSLSRDILFTTDTYVVDPPFFPGGDIGKLAVFGTCNDLAVAGGKPEYLSVGLILEEGLSITDLQKVLSSLSNAAEEADVLVVTGDTKVVPRGKGGEIFINTSGIGEREFPHSLSPLNIVEGDSVVVTGPIGAHGISVLAARERLGVGGGVVSDCAFLYPLCRALFSLGDSLRFMRDATRGGVAAILNETIADTEKGMEVWEEAFPIDEDVASVAEILGLNILEVANEGVIVAVVSGDRAEEACHLLKEYPLGRKASVVGRVTEEYRGKVILKTRIGGRRFLDFPRGLLLPRIC
ncbi:MAG: hydrogenase expression/formation protein HypE [Spirochaetes bacterium]|nr:MAG: hydrogenase expression/formation protein HypE [Spirochaetota bacterium]